MAVLRTIANLTRDMGVNLAGVEIILKMRGRQQQLVNLAREMFNQLDDASKARFEALLTGDEPGLVPTGSQGMVKAEPKPRTTKRKIEIQED